MRNKLFSRSIFAALICAVMLLSLMAPPALTTAQATTLEQRLEQYKKERNINTRQDPQRLKLRCQVAQESLKNLLRRVNTIQTTRAAAYKNVHDALHDLEKRLDDQAFETTDLRNVITAYDTKVAEYTSNMTAYKQAIEDATNVNCIDDPFGFMGALETARLYNGKMVPSITDIRGYLTNTVKPTLQKVKERIASGDTTGSQQ